MPISKTFHNALVAPEKRITFSVKDEKAEREKGKMWAANRRRVSMWGTLRRLKGADAEAAEELYNTEHPDAPFWDGPDGPHYSFWVRFEVYKVRRATRLGAAPADDSQVYYFGGFGNVAAIGMLDMDLYRASVPSTRLVEASRSPPRPLPPDDSLDAPFFIQPA